MAHTGNNVRLGRWPMFVDVPAFKLPFDPFTEDGLPKFLTGTIEHFLLGGEGLLVVTFWHPFLLRDQIGKRFQ